MNDNDLRDICTVIKLRQAALKRKKKEIAGRLYKQQSLFPLLEKKETLVCQTLFAVKADVSEVNMKRLFSPYNNEIQGLQKSFFYLQKLQARKQEAEKLQQVLF
jgi:hypothetical protein